MAASPLVAAAVTAACFVPLGLLLRSRAELRARGPGRRLFTSPFTDAVAKLVIVGFVLAAPAAAAYWLTGDAPARGLERWLVSLSVIGGVATGRTLRWLHWRQRRRPDFA
jgi:hypothetical protein